MQSKVRQRSGSLDSGIVTPIDANTNMSSKRKRRTNKTFTIARVGLGLLLLSGLLTLLISMLLTHEYGNEDNVNEKTAMKQEFKEGLQQISNPSTNDLREKKHILTELKTQQQTRRLERRKRNEKPSVTLSSSRKSHGEPLHMGDGSTAPVSQDFIQHKLENHRKARSTNLEENVEEPPNHKTENEENFDKSSENKQKPKTEQNFKSNEVAHPANAKYLTHDTVDSDGYTEITPPEASHDWRFFFTDVVYQEEFDNFRMLSFQNYTFRQDTPGDFRMRDSPDMDFEAYVTERLVDVRVANYTLLLPSGNRVSCISHLNHIALGAWYVNRRVGFIDCPVAKSEASSMIDHKTNNYIIKLRVEIISRSEHDHRARISEDYHAMVSQESRLGRKHAGATRYYTHYDKYLTPTAIQMVIGHDREPEKFRWKMKFKVPVQTRSAGHFLENNRIDSRNSLAIPAQRPPGVSVCVTMTNANRYTEEIVQYYKTIGISHVYIGFNRRISMKRKINSRADVYGYPFHPTEMDVKETKRTLDSFVQENMVSVVGRRVMDRTPGKATSAGVEKLFFWNSCLAHAFGHGDDYVVINDLDELPVFNMSIATNITKLIDLGLRSQSKGMYQTYENPKSCAIELVRRDAVEDPYPTPLESMLHLENTLGSRFSKRLFEGIQLYQRKIPILPKLFVHKSATSVSFHHAQCQDHRAHVMVRQLPETYGIFLHFSNMFTPRTLRGKYISRMQAYNLYHTQWYPLVLKELCQRKSEMVDIEQHCRFALHPERRPKELLEQH